MSDAEQTARTLLGVDLARLSLLYLAAAELSDGSYVLLRSGFNRQKQRREIRVTVRSPRRDHTCASSTPGADGVIQALDRAVEWLRGAST